MASKPNNLAQQAASLAEFAAKSLIAAERLRVKAAVIEGLTWSDDKRALLKELASLDTTVKRKLATE